MLRPSSFFYWASSQSKAQLDNPKQPATRSQISNALKKANNSIKIGNIIANLLSMFTSPKNLRKALYGSFVICKQLKHRGQHTLDKFMAVKSKLLAVECPLCSEKILQTFILNTELATTQAIQAVRNTLNPQATGPPQPISPSRFSGARKLAKVDSSAKKMRVERTVATRNIDVQMIFLQTQLLLRQLWVIFLRSSTSSSRRLEQELFSRILFLVILCRSAVDFFVSYLRSSLSQHLQSSNLKFQRIKARTVSTQTLSLPLVCSRAPLIENISSRMVYCSHLIASAYRWHLFTSALQSLLRKNSFGKDRRPQPMKIETKANPNKLTKVANTPGSCPRVNYCAMSRQTTMRMAAAQMPPIKIPLMIRDSLTFLLGVNQPESQYYWAKGSTNQHIKKLIQQMTAQLVCTFSSQALSSREDQQMSIGSMTKQMKETKKLRKTSSFAQRGTLGYEQQRIRKPANTPASAISVQQTASIICYYSICIVGKGLEGTLQT